MSKAPVEILFREAKAIHRGLYLMENRLGDFASANTDKLNEVIGREKKLLAQYESAITKLDKKFKIEYPEQYYYDGYSTASAMAGLILLGLLK